MFRSNVTGYLQCRDSNHQPKIFYSRDTLHGSLDELCASAAVRFRERVPGLSVASVDTPMGVTCRQDDDTAVVVVDRGNYFHAMCYGTPEVEVRLSVERLPRFCSRIVGKILVRPGFTLMISSCHQVVYHSTLEELTLGVMHLLLKKLSTTKLELERDADELLKDLELSIACRGQDGKGVQWLPLSQEAYDDERVDGCVRYVLRLFGTATAAP